MKDEEEVEKKRERPSLHTMIDSEVERNFSRSPSRLSSTMGEGAQSRCACLRAGAAAWRARLKEKTEKPLPLE